MGTCSLTAGAHLYFLGDEMQDLNQQNNHRAEQLVVDGCDESGNFVAGGSLPPFAVYDRCSGACLSIEFCECKHAEQMRIAILDGEKSSDVRASYLAGFLPLELVVLEAYKMYAEQHHGYSPSAAKAATSHSGVRVKIKPVKGASIPHYQAEIVSGYRAGKLLCYGQSKTALSWLKEDDARQWLTDTGYTIEPNALQKCYAIGIWTAMAGVESGRSVHRIVIDLKDAKVLAAQKQTGHGFTDLSDSDLANLTLSVIDSCEAHQCPESWGLVMTDTLPDWAPVTDMPLAS